MSIEPFEWSQPQPRIVQYKGRRYALRLESIFWRQLEQIAYRRRVRLGQLVADLKNSYDGPNLSSFVRGFCMVEAERDAMRYRLTSGAFDLLDVLKGATAPALLLSSERLIIEVNQALLNWVAGGSDAATVRQRKFDDIFEPRVVRPLDDTFDLMRSGHLQRTQIQIVNQGRNVTATLTALPVGTIFYCLVWLSVGGGQQRVVRVA